MTIFETRRENIKRLALRYGSQVELARRIGQSPSYVNQLISGASNAGEASSRAIEVSLELPHGWLDQPVPSQIPSVFPDAEWQQLSAEAKQMLLSLSNLLRLPLPTEELALLEAFRTCTAKQRALVLSLAQSHAKMRGGTSSTPSGAA